MNPFGGNSRFFVEVLVILYLVAGMAVTVVAYSNEIRTFDCVEPNAPHGTVTRWTKSYENPDPENCTRRGMTPDVIVSVPFLILVGPILALAKVLRR